MNEVVQVENMIFVERYIDLLQKVDVAQEWEALANARESTQQSRGARQTGTMLTFLRGRTTSSSAAQHNQTSAASEVDEKEQVKVIIGHLLAPLRDDYLQAERQRPVPASLIGDYKALYQDFIKPGADYELNIPAQQIRDLQRSLAPNATEVPSLTCFEAVSDEVLKVLFPFFVFFEKGWNGG